MRFNFSFSSAGMSAGFLPFSSLGSMPRSLIIPTICAHIDVFFRLNGSGSANRGDHVALFDRRGAKSRRGIGGIEFGVIGGPARDKYDG